MPSEDHVKIAPADGKLGVLIPGIGAVTTTFIAGVEAIKRGMATPVGSLTQLSTIRLGKRTDNRTPKIKRFSFLLGRIERSAFSAAGTFTRTRLTKRRRMRRCWSERSWSS